MKKPTLYIKNAKGRYEVYKEEEPQYDNALYRRIKRGSRWKYEPVSMSEAADALSEGVWVVVKNLHGKSFSDGTYLNNCFFPYICQKTSDIKFVTMSELGGLEKLADHLCHHWEEIPRNVSPYDMCRAIVGILYSYKNEKEK